MTGASPWELADRAALRAGVSLRPLATLEDADAVIDLMHETWGDRTLIPREIVRALQASGNEPIGAFTEDRLVGYVLGFLGPGDDGAHLHSHMLAVSSDRRSGGVGYALKLAQRAWALERGVHVVRWTFDPLVVRNAHFNLVKLGAVADRFDRNYYGRMGDALNRGDRSDRMHARWDLDPEPGTREGEPQPAATVNVPTDHAELRKRDPEAARAVREEVAAQLEACFADGLVATSFRPPGTYVFSHATASP